MIPSVSGAGSDDVSALWAALRACPAQLDPGLTQSELTAIEHRFGFTFAPDHRQLLSLALPLGENGRWPDWRSGSESELRDRLSWPVDGLLFDVEHNDLWMPGWGKHPSTLTEALAVASLALRSAPALAPLYSHRYVPTVPGDAGNPVLSCYQADIIYYGRDLLDWFGREFHGDRRPITEPIRHVPFWTWFLESDE